MKKYFIIIPLTAVGFLFVYLSCIDLNRKGISYHASTIFSVQALDSSKTAGFINIAYEFTSAITQTKVIVHRTDASTSDTLGIELGKPVLYNDLDTLAADHQYSYAFALLNGGPTAYDTVTAKTLPELRIISPADTASGDGIDVIWYPVSRDGSNFSDYKVELFKSGTNPDSILHYLTNPIWDTTVTLSAADTIGRVSFVRDTVTVNRPFTVRVTTSKVVKLNLLTDTSVGNRVFFWVSLIQGKR